MTIKKYVTFVMFISMLLLSPRCHAGNDTGVTAHHLLTEYKVNPYIDIAKPRFSWQLQGEGRNRKQTAYHVLVASSQSLLAKDQGDIWDSKKQLSSEMNQIVYGGKPLSGQHQYFWKVRTWDENKQSGPWSKVAIFETAFLTAGDWQAKWIGYDLTHLGKGKDYHLPPVPYLRKGIELKGKVKQARLYATALGLYDFYINGKKVGEDYLNPGWTNYHKRVHYLYLSSVRRTIQIVS